ncbi:DUF1328 domain-containing protein [Robertkochia solimangrovi]|uniref:DUF1328 domain-containing protein n=1 Tax=Robertkochia solimangrovi TaxID=2213046 RepID=UPI00117CC848|nr:DUF1328 family protein [Robertkochia solimangrovi]TRZ42928.1 DUF1328 domain-containing protein [Robertkochia solimangrovi]
MIRKVLIFNVLSMISAVFGFGENSWLFAKILFVIFILLFFVSLYSGFRALPKPVEN